MQASSKVVLNTGILYGRMLLTMGVSLYTTRLVLNALGSNDFGIFSLVAGVIAMLSFLNAAMATSTQRYLSYHQGKNDIAMQRKVFTNSLVLHIIIGVILVVCLEVAGIFLFDGFLNIPINRVPSAKLIYHFMSATVFFTIISVPFNGVLIAHENMLWVACVNIIESLLKLAIALILTVAVGDKLVMYGLLTEGVSVISLILYATYCFKKYQDCTLKGLFVIDKPLVKELSSFTGWNLFGALCGLGKTQGVAIILNVFFGTIVNSAYGIANQVSGQLNFFSSTMLRALNPQIMKSEGADDRQRMVRLSLLASKFGFLLLAIFAVPCIFEMSTLLTFWLKNVPPYTVSFCILILSATMVNQLTVGLDSAIQATGNIKSYMIVVGSIKLLILPFGYLMLTLGYSSYTVLGGYVFFEGLGGVFRLFILNKKIGITYIDYFKNVILPSFWPVALLVSIGLLLRQRETVISIFVEFPAFIILFAISIYLFSLNKNEKEMINKVRIKLFNKVGLSV